MMNKVEIELFAKFKFISQMKANPSQDKLAFLSAKVDLEKNRYVYDLYKIENYKMAKLIQIKDSSSFIWESDDTILFPYTKNKSEERLKDDLYTIYYRYYLQTSKIEKAYEFPFPVTIIKSLGDTLVLQTSINEKDEQLFNSNDKNRKAYLKQRKLDVLYEDIDKIPFYFNGRGFINDSRSMIYLYDGKTKKLTRITNPGLEVSQVLISDDNKRIYYIAQPIEGLRVMYDNVFYYDIETNKTEVLYDKKEYSISFIQFLNKKLICAANDHKLYGLNQNDDFFEIENGDLKLFAEFGYSIGNSIGSDVRLGEQGQVVKQKDRIVFISTRNTHCELKALHCDGTTETLFSAKGSIEGLTIVEDKLYFVGQLKQRLQEIYAFNHGRDQQLTRLNYRTIKDYYIAKPKKYSISDKDREVTGYVLFPYDFDKEKTYPMILDIHGGPKTVYGAIYYHEMQYWASQGYVVVYCNPRGSDGKGDEFADIRGKYGTIDYDDIIEFLDYILKRVPQIDPARQFVTGGSYGGFMTNWIIGHTDRFKAAVSQRSISNWLSFFGTSDIGFYFAKDQTAATPVDDIDLMWQQSPLKYANNVKTPTLFIHSDEDYRCPIEQAMQFYSVLKYKGVDSKLVWFKGETHELSRGGKPLARIKRLREITEWFEKY